MRTDRRKKPPGYEYWGHGVGGKGWLRDQSCRKIWRRRLRRTSKIKETEAKP